MCEHRPVVCLSLNARQRLCLSPDKLPFRTDNNTSERRRRTCEHGWRRASFSIPAAATSESTLLSGGKRIKDRQVRWSDCGHKRGKDCVQRRQRIRPDCEYLSQLNIARRCISVSRPLPPPSPAVPSSPYLNYFQTFPWKHTHTHTHTHTHLI